MQSSTHAATRLASIGIVEDSAEYARTVQELVGDADGLSCPRPFHSGEDLLADLLNLFTQVRAPQWDYLLTEREREVLAELVAGKTKHQIGKALFLSVRAVDTHLRNVYEKLHVNSRTQAVVKAIQEHLVEGEG